MWKLDLFRGSDVGIVSIMLVALSRSERCSVSNVAEEESCDNLHFIEFSINVLKHQVIRCVCTCVCVCGGVSACSFLQMHTCFYCNCK